jgi:GMP synthase (glutamine-hydrolysing)
MEKSHPTILILDFGSQYSQLIARRVRELQVYCELKPWDSPVQELLDYQPRGIILSGGPASIYSPQAPTIPPQLLKAGIPLLGICYGMQALTHQLLGDVAPADEREYGLARLTVRTKNPLIPEGEHQAWMSHGDRIEKVPPGFSILASTANSPIAAVGDLDRSIFGVQFHPEVRHTEIGQEMLRRFVLEICGVPATWTPASIIAESTARIKEQVGDRRVLSAVSGGVDSSVATALVHRAVGDQLEAVFVDTGLLRKGEAEQVITTFQDSLQVRLHPVRAVETFYDILQGVTDPEKKRQIIGEQFIRIFEAQARQLDHPPYLVQGTIYPDVVESSAPDRPQAETIKTHHNVGGLPETMDFELVEPLRYLFKDEVRLVGLELGLPDSLVWRQPFPGPGLAIRCLGEVTQERVQRLQLADAIFLDELRQAGLLRMSQPQSETGSLSSPGGTAQSFAVLLPVKTVGVMGDQRTYQDVVALRAVTTEDFMTADWARLPYDLLGRTATRIVNEVQGINRVVYDITSKPPGTIEWE